MCQGRYDPVRAAVGGGLASGLEGLVLRCECCGLPWARVQGGALVVTSKHHGEPHVNAIALTELARLAETTVKRLDG